MRRGDQTALRRIGSTEGGAVPVLDVVFVHGLGGDGVGTWTPEDSSESWLDWLGQDISSAAIWSLSYPAGATKWTTSGEGMALPERASNLIPTMLHYEIGSRKTVFVCHSLGGLHCGWPQQSPSRNADPAGSAALVQRALTPPDTEPRLCCANTRL